MSAHPAAQRTAIPAVGIGWCVPLPASVISVAATPTFSLIVAGCVDGGGHALDRDGNRLWTYPAGREVWSAACAQDGATVAFGTALRQPAAGDVHLTDRDGRALARFDLEAPVWGLAFDHTGTRLAAATWGNTCHLFERGPEGWRKIRDIAVEGAGAYGVRWIGDSILAVVCYGRGVAVYNGVGEALADYACDAVGYNIAADHDGNLVAGGANATLVTISRSGLVRKLRVPGASRAISAVATLDDGGLHFAGGFDGLLRALTPTGERVWEIDLTGEVWSCCASPSGRLVVAGAGDGRVTLLASEVGVDLLRELDARVAELRRGEAGPGREPAYRAWLDLASRYGLYRYALDFLAAEAERRRIDDAGHAALLEHLGGQCPDAHDDAPALHYARAVHLRRAQRHWDAAVMFLHAARGTTLRLQAYSAAAAEFYRANHRAAALACFRRAREPSLTAADLQLIYTLARAFESNGERAVARDHLDMILVQAPGYRDVTSRLAGSGGAAASAAPAYAALSASLLGPDGPTGEVAPLLRPVADARRRELSIDDDAGASHLAVMEEMFASGVLAPRALVDNVTYDTSAYVKYDFLLPEDDVKKKLEAINLLGLLKRVDGAHATLDVGTATGRYPGILKQLGYDAHGVDISPEAIAYARGKFSPESCPTLAVGDARRLDYPPRHFDFVSCMMGTFYHVPLEDQATALAEMARVCRPRGIVAISTWDLECPHQTFLSMYSVNEEELIVRNSRTIAEMEALFRAAGFDEVGTIRLALVPDTISYDLGIESLDETGIRRLLEIDMAARAATPEKHGQMFIAYGRVA